MGEVEGEGREMRSLHYTAHHNWAWVLGEAIECLHNDSIECKLELRFSNLPSQQISKEKPTYALFRVELTGSTDIIKSYASSLCFAYLDPKDALYLEMKEVNVEHCMPKSLLLEWDREEVIDVSIFPSNPALLKASLGSGGFGLYFVYSSHDITEVIKSHKARAERVEGFLDGLRRDYTTIPHWSLQQLVPSVRVANQNRKCQLRAYVVECNGNLYLFNEYEVRIPCWDIDLDAVLADELRRSKELPADSNTDGDLANRWSYEVENECCGRGNARPYNEQRNKGKTERYLLDEIPELVGCRGAMTRVLRESMKAMKQKILSKSCGDTSSSSKSSMAIAGVDLLVARKTPSELAAGDPTDLFNAYIVEINNNPAMPHPEKHMSSRYRQHLVTLVSSILKLGIKAAAEDDGELINLIDPHLSDLSRWEIL